MGRELKKFVFLQDKKILENKMNNMEIERKFLVKDESYKQESYDSVYVKQAYLCKDDEHIVRVRIKGEKGFLTIKGKSEDGGLSRFEWEKEISLEEAKTLLERCRQGVVEKRRWLVKWKEFTIEVDEFMGENEGLTMAEIEFNNPDIQLESLPNYLKEEVTGDERYYNAYLSQHPYKTWK